MKKSLFFVTLFLLVLSLFACRDNTSEVTDETYLKSTDTVSVTSSSYYYAFKPASYTTGIIFYANEGTNVVSYAPLLHEIADQGYVAFLLKDYYSGNTSCADIALNAYKDVTSWYIGGHGQGGTEAAKYLEKSYAKYEGLFLLSSYSEVNLNNKGLKFLSVYGSSDSILDINKYNSNLSNLGKNHINFVIEGGNGEVSLDNKNNRDIAIEYIKKLIDSKYVEETPEQPTQPGNELVDYKSNAILEVIKAIGTYNIDKTSYETSINNAKSTEEVDTALTNALNDIKSKKDAIDKEANDKKALETAKVNAIADITKAIGTYSIDKTSYETSINNAKTVEEVNTALNNALTDIKSKKDTIDAENAKIQELANAKTNAKIALTNYKAISNYREAEQVLLATAVTNGTTAIENADTVDAVNKALVDAKAIIDNIKTKAEYEAEESLIALNKAKEDAKSEIVKAIGNYTINKTTYENSINDAKTVEQVNSILTTALAEITAKKEAIDKEVADQAALEAAKTAAIAELETYKSVDDYREAEQRLVTSTISTGKSKIEKTSSIISITEVLNEYKLKLDEIKTKAEYEAEEALIALAAKKESAEQEIIAAVGKYDIDYTEYIENINAATSIEEVTTLLESALEEIEDAISDIEYEIALEIAKANAIEEILESIGEYDIEVDATNIQNATTLEEIQEELEEILAEIEDAKAAIDAANALNNAKQSAKDYFEVYDYNNYREAEQILMADAIEEGYSQIDAATSIDEVNASKQALIEALDNLKTKAEYEAEEALALAEAIKEAKETIITAIGEYEIDALEYETILNQATSIEEVEEILASSLLDIENQIIAIELAAAKVTAINTIDELIGEYPINKTKYIETINSATSINDLEEKLEAVCDEINELKQQIDEEVADAEALAAAKEAACDEIESYKSADDYREAEQTILTNQINSAKSKINSSTSIIGINQIVEEYKSRLDSIKTKAEYEAEEKALQDAKDAAIIQINDAIGEYEIDTTEYLNSINEATSIEEVNGLLPSILDDIEDEIYAINLKEAKQQAIIEYTSYKSADDYREAEQVEYNKVINEGLETIKEITDINNIEPILDYLKAIIDTIKTKAEYEAEEAIALANAKTQAINELTNYRNADQYREAEQIQLSAIIAEGTATINKITNIDDIESTLEGLIARIDALKLKADYEAEEALFAEAINNAITTIRSAIGDYDIDSTEYESAINGATSYEELEDLLADILEDITLEKERIDEEIAAQIALNETKSANKDLLAVHKFADLYREAEQALLEKAIQDGNAAIDAANTIEEANNALAAAKAIIDTIKTKAEYEAEEAALNEAKENAIQAIEEAIEGYEIDIEEYTNSIDKASSINEVNSLLTTILDELEELKEEIDQLNKIEITSNSSALSVNGNIVTFETAQTSSVSSSSNKDYISLPVEVSDLINTHVSIKYIGKNVTGIGLHIEGVKNGQTTKEFVATMLPNAWNVTPEIYKSFSILTANISSYSKNYTSISKIMLKFTGAKGTTFELLDYTVTTNGKHNFSMPSGLEFSQMTTASDVATIAFNELGETVITYSTSPKYNTFNISVVNFNPINYMLRFEYSCDYPINIGFASYVTEDKYLKHTPYEAGNHKVIEVDYSKLPTATNFIIKFYFDAAVEVNVTKVLTIHSISFLDFESEIIEARNVAKEELANYKSLNDYHEAQQIELTNAINDGYAAIDAAVTADEINNALFYAKFVIDSIYTKAEIDLINAQENAMNQIITLIGNYNIPLYLYESIIDNCKAAEDVEEILESMLEEINIMIDTLKELTPEKTTVIEYKESVETFYNPDRGFYYPIKVDATPTGATTVSDSHIKDNPFLHLRVDLGAFSSGINNTEDLELTEKMLSDLETILQKIDNYGHTATIRFAYTFLNLKNTEPEMDMILRHIEQFTPLVNKYKYLLTAVECGLIGPWGEMHSSRYANQESYDKVFSKYLSCLDEDVLLLVRRPSYLYQFYGYTLDTLELFDFEKYNRIACYNDGYLGSETDLGTFDDRPKEIAFLEKLNEFAPYGGEVTVPESEYNELSWACEEMFRVNLSYLNIQWNNIVVERWQNTQYTLEDPLYQGQTEFTYIANHMGYRFVCEELSYSVTDTFNFNLKFKNVGFGNLIKAKNLFVILKNGSKEYVYKFDYNKEFDIIKQLDLSNVDNGNYEVYFTLADSYNGSAVRGIQFANTNMYNSTIKANKLTTISINK